MLDQIKDICGEKIVERSFTFILGAIGGAVMMAEVKEKEEATRLEKILKALKGE